MDVSVLTGQMLKAILNLQSKQISVEMLINNKKLNLELFTNSQINETDDA